MPHSGLKLIEGVHNKLLEGLVDIMTVGGLCGRYSLFLRHVAVRYDRTDPWSCCAHNGATSAAPDGSQRLHTSLGDPRSPRRIGGCSLTQGLIYHRW